MRGGTRENQGRSTAGAGFDPLSWIRGPLLFAVRCCGSRGFRHPVVGRLKTGAEIRFWPVHYGHEISIFAHIFH